MPLHFMRCRALQVEGEGCRFMEKLLNVDYPGEIDLLRFSPTGDRLALAAGRGQGKAVLVVETESGKEVARAADLRGVRDILFRSEKAVCIVHDAECRLWDLASERSRVIHKGSAENGNLSPDGKSLALGTNGALLLLDLARPRTPYSVPTPVAGWVSTSAFSPDGRYLALAAASNDYTFVTFVLVWDRQHEKPARLLKLDTEVVEALAFRPDNRLLAVVGRGDISIGLYRLDADRRRREYLDELSPRTFGSERNLLYGTAWSEPAATHSPRAGMIQSLHFSAHGRILKVVGYGGSAARLYARSGRVLNESRPPDGYPIQTTAVSSRGRAVGVVADSGSLLCWDVPHWRDP